MNRTDIDGKCCRQIDYDLNGLVRIRLLDASPEDSAAITRQLGLRRASFTGEPEIVIRFVAQLPTSYGLRLVGGDAAFTDEAFLVLRNKRGDRSSAQIAFDQIGKRCEIICETGVGTVPLLIPILNLTMLGKGVIPLHAAAFTFEGTGVLATGWSHGSKTGMLLAFMARGAAYIGDDWVYIGSDGQRMYGLPEPISVRASYLHDLPQYAALIGRRDRLRLRALTGLLQVMRQISLEGGASKRLAAKVMRRVSQGLGDRLYVHMAPQKLFGESSCALTGVLDKVFMVVSHETPEVIVQAMDPQEITDRIVFALQYEQLAFMSYYLKFRYAFPGATNEIVERSEQLQRELLTSALSDKQTYTIYHPFPVRPPSLFAAVSPLLP